VPSRRLEDRIRELCAQAVASGDADFSEVLAQLRSAMHQHIEEMRKMVVEHMEGKNERRFRANE
jgi:hypothetical protein